MPVSVNEHLILDNEGTPLEFYLTEQGNIFVQPTSEADAMHFWFTISPEDWKVMKPFIDRQFEG